MTVSSKTGTAGAFRGYRKGTVLRDSVAVETQLFHWYESKSATVHGDRVSVYPYHRHWQEVSLDVPFVNRLYNFSSGKFDRIYTDYISGFYPHPYFGPPGLYGEILGNARSQAITEALNKLRAGKVENGVDLAEARKTAGMVASQAKQLLYAFRAMRRGNFALAAKQLGLHSKDVIRANSASAANRWLEYQYGWKPLMGAIHDNVALICDQVSHGIPMGIKAVRTVRQDCPHIVYGVAQRESIEQHWTGKVVAQVGLAANVSCPPLVGADMYGLINPLAIAWELVPFSFVFDWFIPVGNVLGALSATAGLSFASGWVTTKLYSKLESTWNMNLPTTVTDPGKMIYQDVTFDRQLLTGFPLPELYGKRNPFSTPHILSAIALIRQHI